MSRPLSAAEIADFITKTVGRRYCHHPLLPEVEAELDRREAAGGPRATEGNKHYRYDHSEKGAARRHRYNTRRFYRRLRERIASGPARIAAMQAEVNPRHAALIASIGADTQ
jgi:hypothetical protein